ncbi:MAG: hypothetical protein U1A77_16070 [Pirellulales bacterium]
MAARLLRILWSILSLMMHVLFIAGGLLVILGRGCLLLICMAWVIARELTRLVCWTFLVSTRASEE